MQAIIGLSGPATERSAIRDRLCLLMFRWGLEGKLYYGSMEGTFDESNNF
jgi:hypothetical protein